MTYTETTPSAANEEAKNEHITSLPWILPELYLLSPVFAQASNLYPNTVIGHGIGGNISQLKWRVSLKTRRWSKR
jgi:hypothetical protein